MTSPKPRRSLDHPLPDLFTDDEWQAICRQLRLPKRQGEIARLICRGHRDAAIAMQLGLSTFTVRMHAKRLLKQLKVHDRVGVVVRLIVAQREVGKD